MLFTPRLPGMSAIYVGNYSQNSALELPSIPTVGDSATLHSGKYSIQVKILEVSNDMFAGEILAFGNGEIIELEGSHLGEKVTFRNTDVIAFTTHSKELN